MNNANSATKAEILKRWEAITAKHPVTIEIMDEKIKILNELVAMGERELPNGLNLKEQLEEQVERRNLMAAASH